ncbi:unnamed protein product [Anisakis simplex]|uniref:Ion_trans domain-containing protein n=1 Tax=Anisakis simplex TaxID=6269 RepID=A0A0M3J754_ANISI|nr:unnamed protein product [Anisakis simplex]
MHTSACRTNARLLAIRQFFRVLMNPVDRFPLDLYAPMFLCDVICFLIVIFGYSGFGADGSSEGGVASYFEENKVPGTLVSMLIFQFVLIILDRAIFLRKFLFAKIVFQVNLLSSSLVFRHLKVFFEKTAKSYLLKKAKSLGKTYVFLKVEILGNRMLQRNSYITGQT